jgi:alanine racemase
MDSSYVDVTEKKDLVLGDIVQFWGEHMPVEEVTYNVGTDTIRAACGFNFKS